MTSYRRRREFKAELSSTPCTKARIRVVIGQESKVTEGRHLCVLGWGLFFAKPTLHDSCRTQAGMLSDSRIKAFLLKLSSSAVATMDTMVAQWREWPRVWSKRPSSVTLLSALSVLCVYGFSAHTVFPLAPQVPR